MTRPIDTEAPLEAALGQMLEDYSRALRLCPPSLLASYGGSASSLAAAVAEMAAVYIRHQEKEKQVLDSQAEIG